MRVLLLWPGSEGAAAGNFGVPQLVLLGTWLRERTGAEVTIVDLAVERALGPIDFARVLDGDGRGYDIIGLSIYSSFDWLKCVALAQMARERWPDVVLVAGGYHASARPLEVVDEASPFDVVVVGEGELPLVTVVESVRGGAPLRKAVLGPEPLHDLDVLPPSDWSLLSRYRGVARRVASQAQVYLSRGCPFDCAFCMERAKRETSWRPLSVERAVEEVVSLHRFLDLRSWTVYFGDALFGMRKSWRRQFLEALAARDLPVEKFWLLIRVDLVEDEDLKLFGAANCGLGFGLESGDPGQLAIIRKSGRLDDYLERMEHIAERAREYDVPWGANVICGHPGETEASMRTSAAWLHKLFVRERGTTGFLSVDPFRLYPGSPIDAERQVYEREYGTRFHAPQWWHEGDPEFLSEWVDPSATLDWRTREALQHELLMPVLAQIESHFVYRGKARAYFLRAVREQLEFCAPQRRLHDYGRYYAWQRYLGRRAQAQSRRRDHPALREAARACRATPLDAIGRSLSLPEDAPVLCALREVEREQFVPLDHVAESVADVALPLDDSGGATISAMHAYARAYQLLQIEPGDRVLDLGSGSGYGTAILQRLVGALGHVVAIELDPALVARARELVPPSPHTVLAAADALEPSQWPPSAHTCSKVAVGFCPGETVPASWHAALPPGARVVVPLADAAGGQTLVLATRTDEGFALQRLEAVHFVAARRTVAPAVPVTGLGAPAEPVHLRVL
ncbi:MAG: radical SAM protein [Nannocystaceae bacterium]|nr:radical SAM protein [Nannocystaceae bacterium]